MLRPKVLKPDGQLGVELAGHSHRKIRIPGETLRLVDDGVGNSFRVPVQTGSEQPPAISGGALFMDQKNVIRLHYK